MGCLAYHLPSPARQPSNFIRQHINNVVEPSQINGLDDFGLLINGHWRFWQLDRTIKSRIYTWNETTPRSFTHSSNRTNCSCLPCGHALMSILIDSLEEHGVQSWRIPAPLASIASFFSFPFLNQPKPDFWKSFAKKKKK